MYQKSIYDLDYKKLKKRDIKCLIFDLDNTIALLGGNFDLDKTKELFTSLKIDFRVAIISNGQRKRVRSYAELLEVDYISRALKPLPLGLTKIKNKYHLKKPEMCMIGDQLLTDILSGNLFGSCTVLVDPLGKKDLKITGVNRLIEKQIFHVSKKLKRGNYYE